ncbi:MAG: hypothetical protein QNK05_05160 [Myxococcota bacterium]|nr:hypothetical protein [Myxococcota bacterium]
MRPHVRLLFIAATGFVLVGSSPPAIGVPPTVGIEVKSVVGTPDGWPLSVGVPLARAASLPRSDVESNLGLSLADGLGTAGPAALELRSAWQDDDGTNPTSTDPAQWVGVDFQYVVGQDSYTVGPATAPVAHPDPVLVTPNATNYTISTGDMVAVVPKAGQGPLLESVSVDGSAVVDQGTDPVQWFQDRRDPRRMHHARSDMVTVEKDNGLHAIVKVKGRYVDQTTQTDTCHFVTRLHFYAGHEMIGIQHTFIFEGDPTQLQIDEMALEFKAAGTNIIAAAADADESRTWVREPLAAGESLSAYQKDHYHWGVDPVVAEPFTVDKIDSAGAVTNFADGIKAGPWAAAHDGTTTTGLILRDLWEQFPKQLLVTRDGITAYLWSSRDGGTGGVPEDPPLDLSVEGMQDFQGGVDDQNDVPSAADGPFFWEMKNIGSEWEDYKEFHNVDDDRTNPTGVAKTHDLLLTFFDQPNRFRSVSDYALAFDDPPAVHVAPQQVADSGVVGPIGVKNDQLSALEQAIDDIWDEIVEMREDWGEYGYVYWGLLTHNNWALAAPRGSWPDVYPGKLIPRSARYTLDFGATNSAWIQFLRSGERKYLQLARGATRFFADWKVSHLDSPNRVVGGFWENGSTPGANPWFSNFNQSQVQGIFLSHVESVLLDYYVTGDRRSLDVFQEMEGPFEARAVAFNAANPPALPYKQTQNDSRKSWDDVYKASAYYNQTGKQAYLDFATGLIDLLADASPSSPYAPYAFPLDPHTKESGPAVLWPYYSYYKHIQITGHQRYVTGPEADRAESILRNMAQQRLWPQQEVEPWKSNDTVKERAEGVGGLMADAWRDPGNAALGSTPIAHALQRLRDRHDRVYYDDAATATWPILGGVMPALRNVVENTARLTAVLSGHPDWQSLYQIYDPACGAPCGGAPAADISTYIRYKQFGEPTSVGVDLVHDGGLTSAYLVYSDVDDPPSDDWSVVDSNGNPVTLDAVTVLETRFANTYPADEDDKPQHRALLLMSTAPPGTYTIVTSNPAEKLTLFPLGGP